MGFPYGMIAHDQHGIDLLKIQRTRQQCLSKSDSDLFVDLAMGWSSAEILPVEDSAEADNAV